MENSAICKYYTEDTYGILRKIRWNIAMLLKTIYPARRQILFIEYSIL